MKSSNIFVKCPKCNSLQIEPYETYIQNHSEIYLDDENGFKKGSGELLYKCSKCDCLISVDIEFDCKITAFKVDDVTDIIKEY